MADDDNDLTPEAAPDGPSLEDVLDRVWCAAVDAASSPDFRQIDGELDEDTYLRYKGNVLDQASRDIRCDDLRDLLYQGGITLSEYAAKRIQILDRTQQQPSVEYGLLMAGGGMQVRNPHPDVERIYPLVEWIRNEQQNGAKVYRRRVVVIEDWTEVEEQPT